MTIGIATAWGVTLGSLLILSMALVLRLNAYRRAAQRPVENSIPFTMDRYRPMASLLAEDDFAFLKSRPGYRAEIGAKLKRDRREVFRLYLRELAGDFQRLHAEARRSLVNSPAEHAELVGILMQQQVAFWRAMAAVEFRLTLDQLGLGKVDASGLLNAFESMQTDLARFATPLPAAS